MVNKYGNVIQVNIAFDVGMNLLNGSEKTNLWLFTRNYNNFLNCMYDMAIWISKSVVPI